MEKRVFALLLCLIMCLSLLPVSAFADDCNHEGEDTIVLMPAKVTCGEAYREHYKCTRCGKLFSDPKDRRGAHECHFGVGRYAFGAGEYLQGDDVSLGLHHL